MSEAPAGLSACPFCAAEARPGAKYCWLCGAKMEAARPAHPARADIVISREEVENRMPASASESEQASPGRFGLATLIVVLTLAVVLLGIWPMAPGVGVVLTAISVLGLIGLAGVSSAAGKRKSQIAAIQHELQPSSVLGTADTRAAALTPGEKAAAFMRPVAITLLGALAVLGSIALVVLGTIIVVIVGILQTCATMCSPPPGH